MGRSAWSLTQQEIFLSRTFYRARRARFKKLARMEREQPLPRDCVQLCFLPLSRSRKSCATLAPVGWSEPAMMSSIGGFIVGGNTLANNAVIVRAIGPSLAQGGVTNSLADPTLELHNASGAIVGSNDDWQDAPRKHRSPRPVLRRLTLTSRRFMRRCPPATTLALCAAPAIPLARPWSRSPTITNRTGAVELQLECTTGVTDLGYNLADWRICGRLRPCSRKLPISLFHPG